MLLFIIPRRGTQPCTGAQHIPRYQYPVHAHTRTCHYLATNTTLSPKPAPPLNTRFRLFFLLNCSLDDKSKEVSAKRTPPERDEAEKADKSRPKDKPDQKAKNKEKASSAKKGSKSQKNPSNKKAEGKQTKKQPSKNSKKKSKKKNKKR